MLFELSKMTRNALMNPYEAEAAYRQSPSQHEALLNKYVKPGMSPAELMLALDQGRQEEAAEPRYWNDQLPRRDIGASSSWIDSIEYLPDMGLASFSVNGRQYFYPMSSDEVGDLINSDSIGQNVSKMMKR